MNPLSEIKFHLFFLNIGMKCKIAEYEYSYTLQPALISHSYIFFLEVGSKDIISPKMYPVFWNIQHNLWVHTIHKL